MTAFSTSCSSGATSASGRSRRKQLLDAFRRRSTDATLTLLEQEASSLARAPFGIGHIALGCGLSYLDFRFVDLGWRGGYPQIAAWHASFAERPSAESNRSRGGLNARPAVAHPRARSQPHHGRALGRRRSWPISAPTSSRSSARASATTRAAGARPSSRTRTASRRSEAGYYLSVNRGKRSITLDLDKPEGQAIVRALAARSDIVLENFKVGTLASASASITTA